MTTTHPELHTSRQFQGLILPAHRTSGTEDDDDDRDDEHADENEADLISTGGKGHIAEIPKSTQRDVATLPWPNLQPATS